MTQKEFYARLDSLMDAESTFDLIPPLIMQARADGLSILISFQKNEKGESVAAYGMLQGRMFLLCAPKWDATDYGAYTLAETEITGLFEDLITDGYGGIAFQKNGTVYGIEWSDFDRTKPGPNDPCPCGSGRNTRNAVGGNL